MVTKSVTSPPTAGELDELLARWLPQARKGWLEFFILSLLRAERSYGYEIASRLRESLSADLPEGTLYPLLRRLERDRLVQTEWDTEGGGNPRKYYRITPAGRTVCGRMAEEWARWQRSIEQLGGST